MDKHGHTYYHLLLAFGHPRGMRVKFLGIFTFPLFFDLFMRKKWEILKMTKTNSSFFRFYLIRMKVVENARNLTFLYNSIKHAKKILFPCKKHKKILFYCESNYLFCNFYSCPRFSTFHLNPWFLLKGKLSNFKYFLTTL